MQEVLTEKLRLLQFEFTAYPGNATVPELDDNGVHVWFAPAPGHSLQPAQFKPVLSSDELARVARFRFDSDRENFVFARGMLRILLGTYLEIAGQGVRFSYSEKGKPYLASQPGAGLQFNLSHSSGAVQLAICRNRSIGADIERVREDLEVEEIAARFFSQKERQTLMSLPAEQRHDAFFRCWTRKEALLKAKASGLSFSLDLFDVSMTAGEKNVALSTRPDPQEAARWRIYPVTVRAGYAAAVAVGLNE